MAKAEKEFFDIIDKEKAKQARIAAEAEAGDQEEKMDERKVRNTT